MDVKKRRGTQANKLLSEVDTATIDDLVGIFDDCDAWTERFLKGATTASKKSLIRNLVRRIRTDDNGDPAEMLSLERFDPETGKSGRVRAPSESQ